MLLSKFEGFDEARQQLLRILAHHMLLIAERVSLLNDNEAKGRLLENAYRQWSEKAIFEWKISSTEANLDSPLYGGRFRTDEIAPLCLDSSPDGILMDPSSDHSRAFGVQENAYPELLLVCDVGEASTPLHQPDYPHWQDSSEYDASSIPSSLGQASTYALAQIEGQIWSTPCAEDGWSLQNVSGDSTIDSASQPLAQWPSGGLDELERPMSADLFLANNPIDTLVQHEAPFDWAPSPSMDYSPYQPSSIVGFLDPMSVDTVSGSFPQEAHRFGSHVIKATNPLVAAEMTCHDAHLNQSWTLISKEMERQNTVPQNQFNADTLYPSLRAEGQDPQENCPNLQEKPLVYASCLSPSAPSSPVSCNGQKRRLTTAALNAVRQTRNACTCVRCKISTMPVCTVHYSNFSRQQQPLT